MEKGKLGKLEVIAKAVTISLVATGLYLSSGCSQSEKNYNKIPTTQKYDFDRASPMDGMGL